MPKPPIRAELLVAVALLSPALHAEVSEIKVAQQYGIGYLPLMLMEEQKLAGRLRAMDIQDMGGTRKTVEAGITRGSQRRALWMRHAPRITWNMSLR